MNKLQEEAGDRNLHPIIQPKLTKLQRLKQFMSTHERANYEHQTPFRLWLNIKTKIEELEKEDD